MKKLTSKILFGVFSLGFAFTSIGEEHIPINLFFEDESRHTDIYDKPIILNKGDSLKLINIIRGSSNAEWLYARITITRNDQEYSTNVQLKTQDYMKTAWDFTGPMKVEFGGYSVGSWIVATAVLTRADEKQGRNVTGYSLVLPEGADGKQKLVLESSTDLVSWTEDSLGSKDSSDKKRFYRLRAVKE